MPCLIEGYPKRQSTDQVWICICESECSRFCAAKTKSKKNKLGKQHHQKIKTYDIFSWWGYGKTGTLTCILAEMQSGTILMQRNLKASNESTYGFTFWPSNFPSKNLPWKYISNNTKVCMSGLFTAALFIITKYWKQSKCLNARNGWVHYGTSKQWSDFQDILLNGKIKV